MGDAGVSLDEAELAAWGRRLGAEVGAPLVIALRGDLGAGKTTLARAIVRGAGVTGAVPSPTFNLLFLYAASGGRTIRHFDLYRLEAPEEVWELGWEELGAPGDLVLIEWPERAEALLPSPRWEIALEEDAAGSRRRVRFREIGSPSPIPLPLPDESAAPASAVQG